MVDILERQVPELLINDLIEQNHFKKYSDPINFFSNSPLTEINTKGVYSRQEALNFFVEDFGLIDNLYKMPSEPVVFRIMEDAKVNITDVGLSACYFQSMMNNSVLALTR